MNDFVISLLQSLMIVNYIRNNTQNVEKDPISGLFQVKSVHLIKYQLKS